MGFFNSDKIESTDPETLTVLEYLHKKKRLQKKIDTLEEEKKPIDERIAKIKDEIVELEKNKPPLKYIVKYQWNGHFDFGMYPPSLSVARDMYDKRMEWKERKFMTYKGAKKFIGTIKEDNKYSFIKILKEL